MSAFDAKRLLVEVDCDRKTLRKFTRGEPVYHALYDALVTAMRRLQIARVLARPEGAPAKRAKS